MESTHGYYDILKERFDRNKSILPMNINTDYWGNTWGSRDALKSPQNNIDAGTKMLKSISTAMPGASIAKRATVYNKSTAKKVSDYGTRVEKIYSEKPWLHWKKDPESPWSLVFYP